MARKSNFHAQGGPALPDEQPTQTKSGLAIPTTQETFDINKPQHQAAAVARMTRYGLAMGKSHPDVVSEGAQWYHQAAAGLEQTRGKLSREQGAGIAAVASPGSDWEGRNKHVLGEVQSLRKKDWALISRTTKEATQALAAKRLRGEAEKNERPTRHEDVTAMLHERAPLLGATTNKQILKAGAILKGVDPEKLMPRETSPKTNAFYRGILNPHHQESRLAIDYRMADIAANTMRPYGLTAKMGMGTRGLDTAHPGSVGEQRYQGYENVVASAGRAMAKRGGSQFAAYNQPLGAQAGFWVMGKGQEMEHPEAKVGKGPNRSGQQYMTERGVPVRY